jgi:hypothetical protein
MAVVLWLCSPLVAISSQQALKHEGLFGVRCVMCVRRAVCCGFGGSWVISCAIRPGDAESTHSHVLGPVPGVGVMAKRSQGWVKCEDRLPYYRDSSCSLPLPRLHGHNSTTREDLAVGAGAPGAKGPLEWGSWGFNAARGRCSGQLRSKKMSRASHL